MEAQQFDGILSSLGVLLVLSVINEKIVAFIRQYLSQSWLGIVFRRLFPEGKSPLRHISGPAALKSSPEQFQDKATDISILSIITGISLAAVINANLFEIFSKIPPGGTLTWKDQEFSGWSIPGILLTGFFLSFGSRFFHDLLDLIFQIKNIQRARIRDSTGRTTAASGIAPHRKAAITKAFERFRQQFIHLHEVRGIALVPVYQGGVQTFAPEVRLRGRDRSEVPEVLEYELYGKRAYVKVVFREKSSKASISASPGDGIAPSDSVFRGSYGGLVKHDATKDEFILTCSHVVMGGDSTNLRGWIEDGDDIQEFDRDYDVGRRLGTIAYALRTNRFDVALIEPLKDRHDNNLPYGRLWGALDVTDSHVGNLRVHLYGANSESTGYLITKDDSTEIDYGDAVNVTLDGLLRFSKRRSDPHHALSVPGDSGSVLYDDNNEAVGLVVAASEEFTWAIPIKRVLDQTETTFNDF